jgi:hypothetical protein
VARRAHQEDSAAASTRRLRRREKLRANPEPALRGRPLTAEILEELGNGGPWDSDEEFEEFLAALQRSRRAS